MKRGVHNGAQHKIEYGFAAIPNAMLDDERLEALDVRAYGILLAIDQDRDGVVKISEHRLGERLRRSADTGRRCLRRLEATGWIKAKDNGNGNCRDYELALHPYGVSAWAPESGRKTLSPVDPCPGSQYPDLTLMSDREENPAAWTILDDAWPVIRAKHKPAITQEDWCKQNRSAAKALANLGKTAAEAVELLNVAYEHRDARFYRTITTLAKLQEHWHKLEAIAEGPEESAEEINARRMRGDFLPRR